MYELLNRKTMNEFTDVLTNMIMRGAPEQELKGIINHVANIIDAEKALTYYKKYYTNTGSRIIPLDLDRKELSDIIAIMIESHAPEAELIRAIGYTGDIIDAQTAMKKYKEQYCKPMKEAVAESTEPSRVLHATAKYDEKGREIVDLDVIP